MKKLLLLILIFSMRPGIVLSQTSPSVLYVPLIGITSVPKPLALPSGPGNVTYSYAVKNFLSEVPLTDVLVTDDKCKPVRFVTGDDNGDTLLDYSETWRFTCTTRLSETTNSTATAIGTANNLTAKHRAYATVILGKNSTPPLVSIINITKVAYPLSLPRDGGKITFTYKVNNPGVIPLSGVTISDDKCPAMSNKLGDTNANNLLDTNEVWIYTCTATLKQTTSNTAIVTAYANGLKAVGEATITVEVDIPRLPQVGATNSFKFTVWSILASVLVLLVIFSVSKPPLSSRKVRK